MVRWGSWGWVKGGGSSNGVAGRVEKGGASRGTQTQKKWGSKGGSFGVKNGLGWGQGKCHVKPFWWCQGLTLLKPCNVTFFDLTAQPHGGDQEGWGPRRVGGPKFRAFFPSPRSKIRSFSSLSGGLLVELPKRAFEEQMK